MTFLKVKVLNSSNFRYTQNGILHMLDRNKRIKPRPERFQNCKDVFDLILTCEERVYDQVVEGKELELINQVNFECFFPLLPEVFHKSGNTSVSSDYCCWNTSTDKSLQSIDVAFMYQRSDGWILISKRCWCWQLHRMCVYIAILRADIKK